MSADSQAIEGERSAGTVRKQRGKTKLLSLDDLDRRTASAKHVFELRDALLVERGGAEHMSTLSLALVDSVATLTGMIADAQTRWLRGEPIDPATLATLINARRREAELVGINPEPLDVTPDLQHYMRGKTA